jgi:hypothetical protein
MNQCFICSVTVYALRCHSSTPWSRATASYIYILTFYLGQYISCFSLFYVLGRLNRFYYGPAYPTKGQVCRLNVADCKILTYHIAVSFNLIETVVEQVSEKIRVKTCTLECSVRNLTGIPNILAEIFHGFLQSLGIN